MGDPNNDSSLKGSEIISLSISHEYWKRSVSKLLTFETCSSYFNTLHFFSNVLIHAGLLLVLEKKHSISKVYTIAGRSTQWLISAKFFNVMFHLAYSWFSTIFKAHVAQLLKVKLECFRRT